MGLSFELKLNRLPEIAARLHPAVQAALVSEGERMRDDWKAHAPVDTGRYRDSIQSEADGDSVTISSDVNYSIFLEYGTWKMAARPSFTPAKEAEAARFPEAMDKAISGAVG